MRTPTISLRARLTRAACALAIVGTVMGGIAVSPAQAGGRRGPHEPGQYAKGGAVPVYDDNGRVILSRKGRSRTVVVPGGPPPVAYTRSRRARAYNPPVYGPGYYDPYYAPFPSAPAYTYDPNYRRGGDGGRDAVTIIAGTAGGAAVGGLMGGKKGAIIGGIIGAAASTVIAATTDGKNDRYYPY